MITKISNNANATTFYGHILRLKLYGAMDSLIEHYIFKVLDGDFPYIKIEDVKHVIDRNIDCTEKIIATSSESFDTIEYSWALSDIKQLRDLVDYDIEAYNLNF